MGFWVAIVLFLLASGPVALILVLRMRGELRAMRRALESRADASGTDDAAAQSLAVGVPSTDVPAAMQAPSHRDFEAAFGAAWLTWLGILALFFGTAFFLAIDLRGSVVAGAGQVLIGAVVGVLFLAAGRVAARRAQRFLGLGLLGGGIALLDLAAFAAHGFHRIVPGAVVYPFLLAVAVLGALLALRENSRTIVALTLVGALVTPLFLRAESNPALVLFPYLVAINLGAALVATRRAWHALPLLAFAGTCLDAGVWWARDYDRDVRGLTIAGTTALWLVFGWQGLVGGPSHRPLGIARGVVTLANAIAYAAAWHALLAPDLAFLRGLVIAGLALVSVAVGRAALARGADAGSARMTEYAGIVLAAVAVPVQFDLAWVGLAWAALALVLVQAGVALRSPVHRTLGLALLVAAAFRILFFDTRTALAASPDLRPVLNGEFAIGVCVAGAMFVAAWILSRGRSALAGAADMRWIPVLVVGGAAQLLWRVSVEVLASFTALDAARARPDSGRAALLALSLVWAVYAGIAIVAGLVARYRPLRVFGMAVLGLLVLKVFVFDLQVLERGYRIASFAGVGALLLAISVLYQRERRS